MEEITTWLQNLILEDVNDCICYLELKKLTSELEKGKSETLEIFLDEERKPASYMKK